MSGTGSTPAPDLATTLRQAVMLLQLAEQQLGQNPAECGPGRMPGLLSGSYQALAALAAILGDMAGADLEPARRADLTEAGVHLASVLAALHPHSVPPPE